MLTLHIANKNYSSWSLRPWVLLRELDIPFEEKLSVFSEDSNWQSFRTFSPTGLVPCLVDGDEVVWDSLAITEYLAETHAQVWPQSKSARTWARCASGEMHSGFFALREQCSMNCGARVRLKQITTSLRKDLDRLDELLGQGLERFGGGFLAGELFTAVDAFYAPVALRVQTFGLAAEFSPAVASYFERLLLLPSMQEWYGSGLQEPWREPGHEAELTAWGEVVEDFRQG